jgi:hypothetical protein
MGILHRDANWKQKERDKDDLGEKQKVKVSRRLCAPMRGERLIARVFVTSKDTVSKQVKAESKRP